MMAMHFSDSVQKTLDCFVEKAREIFGGNLTGVYLHGSLAMGCFCQDKSDIDLIVVVEDDITDGQKLQFMEEVTRLNKTAPEKGIEMSVVKAVYCREFVYPTPFELHFSIRHLDWFERAPEEYISRMKGTDPDLAAHFTIINHYGIVLYGKQIGEVFAQVPRKDYVDSILSDIENAGEDILKNPVYVVLNLCRVLAFLKEGQVFSKRQGGEWGVEHIDAVYRGIVRDALRCYASDEIMAVDREEAWQFCHMMQEAIAMYRFLDIHPGT